MLWSWIGWNCFLSKSRQLTSMFWSTHTTWDFVVYDALSTSQQITKATSHREQTARGDKEVRDVNSSLPSLAFGYSLRGVRNSKSLTASLEALVEMNEPRQSAMDGLVAASDAPRYLMICRANCCRCCVSQIGRTDPWTRNKGVQK